MAKQQLLLPGEVVKKSNAIARAQWQPQSVWEPRIVALVASKVRTDDEDFFTYKISVSELTGVSDENLSGYQYQEIAQSIAHLCKATIRIQGNKPRNFRQYNIFSMCGYEDGYLIAGFHPDLKPHFLGLQEKFTEYNLMQFLLLPSTYSQRIFEYLKSWDDKQELEVSLSELHEMLNTPESYRKNFTELRRWVLEKAHKDILKHTNLYYEWEPIKKGRAVVSIRFIFTKKRALPVSKSKETEVQEKKSKQNNKAFLTALACRKERGPACDGGHQKESVCELCRQIGG